LSRNGAHIIDSVSLTDAFAAQINEFTQVLTVILETTDFWRSDGLIVAVPCAKSPQIAATPPDNLWT
jgi:hypothetical protein